MHQCFHEAKMATTELYKNGAPTGWILFLLNLIRKLENYF